MKMKAKKKMLQELKEMMRSDSYSPMAEDLQKVTVMSDSEEGLQEGLSKAEEILQKRKAMMEDMDEDEDSDEDDEGEMDLSSLMKRMSESEEEYFDGGVKPMGASKSLGSGEAYEEDDDKKKEERRRILTDMLKKGKFKDSKKSKEQ